MKLKLINAKRRPARSRRRTAALGGSPRGVALILVLTTVAILTSIGVDFSYSTRVSLRLAETARDEMRAYMLARSAINLSRLLLHFQKQVDGLGGQLSNALTGLLTQGKPPPPPSPKPPPPPGGVFPTGAGTPGANLGIRLWEILPIDSNAMGAVLSGATSINPDALGADRPDTLTERLGSSGLKLPPGVQLPPGIQLPPGLQLPPGVQLPQGVQGPPGAPLAAQPGQPGAPRDGKDRAAAAPPDSPEGHVFGNFDGSFSAKIVDENSRINVVGLDGLGTTPLATLIQLRAMMADPKFDFIFDEEDANHDRVRRDDVILALKDWIDLDETGSGLDPTNTSNPFVNAFSDENSAYDRYTPRYKAKNAHFDSLQELFQVRGVNDRFMAAFGDRLTIWPDINSKLNINTNDPQQMVINITIAAQNPNDPTLRDPRLLQTILQEIQLKKMFSFFGLSAADFVAILQANNVRVRPEIDPKQNGNAANFFGSTSDTFRITATGRVGRIAKTITAVVKYDDLLGKLLYWKEE